MKSEVERKNSLKKILQNIGNKAIGLFYIILNTYSIDSLYVIKINAVYNKCFRHEKHLAFQRKYPEKFAPEEAGGPYGGSLPVYLSNVCLRFIPVLDIVVHRYIEIPQASKSLDLLLDHLGCLYKFHGNSTLHFQHFL